MSIYDHIMSIYIYIISYIYRIIYSFFKPEYPQNVKGLPCAFRYRIAKHGVVHEDPWLGRPRSGPFGVIGGVYGGLLSHGVRRVAAPQRDVKQKNVGEHIT